MTPKWSFRRDRKWNVIYTWSGAYSCQNFPTLTACSNHLGPSNQRSHLTGSFKHRSLSVVTFSRYLTWLMKRRTRFCMQVLFVKYNCNAGPSIFKHSLEISVAHLIKFQSCVFRWGIWLTLESLKLQVAQQTLSDLFPMTSQILTN